MSADTLIFLHIAKTAGTSIGAALVRNFDPAECASGFSRTAITALGMTEADTVAEEIRPMIQPDTPIRFVGGHIGFGVHRHLPDRRPLYLSVVREPVERAISNFSYVARREIVPGISADLSITEYLERGPANLWFSNAQVRVLSEDPAVNGSGLPTTADLSMCRPLAYADYRNVRRQVLSPRFLLCPLENLDEMMVLLAGLFRLPLNALVFGRDNVNDKRPELNTLPKQTLAAIRRANLYDRMLYRLAQGRMAEICSCLGQPFAADVALFRHLQAQFAAGVALTDLPATHPTWTQRNWE